MENENTISENHPRAAENQGTGLVNDYRFEQRRLDSFVNWPVRFITPRAMATAGFYYTGIEDLVKCFECQLGVRRWVEGDDPQSDHNRWRPSCRFVQGLNCGNVPIGVDHNDFPPDLATGRESQRYYEGEDHTGIFSLIGNPVPVSLHEGISNQTQPGEMVHPEYINYFDRLETFQIWPISMPQTKEQLAAIGFFHTGIKDQTVCYYCGGILANWEPTDDPRTEHARWFEKCKLTKAHKEQVLLNDAFTRLTISPPEGQSPPHPSEQATSSPQPTDEPEPKARDVNKTDFKICKVCYVEELEVMFLPCGHIATCTKCAFKLTSCAICRKHIHKMLRAIIS